MTGRNIRNQFDPFIKNSVISAKHKNRTGTGDKFAICNQPTIALQALQVCLLCCNLIVTTLDIIGETLILEMHTCCIYKICRVMFYTLSHTKTAAR